MANSSVQQTIQNNRKKCLPIIKTLVFCTTNNLPIRGKTDEKAVFNILLQFRVESGDTILKEHLATSQKNASYISHRTQNDLIKICNEVIRENIIKDAKKSFFFL